MLLNAKINPYLSFFELQDVQLLSFTIFIHLKRKKIFLFADPWFSTVPMTLIDPGTPLV